MKNRDLGLLVLRLGISLMMIPHGINKLLHPEAFQYVQATLEAKGLPIVVAFGVFIAEIIAPFLLLIGFRTRLAALIMVFNGISILYLAYGEKLTTFTQHGGWAPELPALFLLGALVLCFTSGGKYALSSRNKWD